MLNYNRPKLIMSYFFTRLYLTNKAFKSLPKVALINDTARNPTKKIETLSKCKTRPDFRFTVHF